MDKLQFNFRRINYILILMVVAITVLIIFVDYPRALLETNPPPPDPIRFWYFDPAFGFNSGQQKGPGMVIAVIFNIVAGIAFLAISVQLFRQKIKKQNHYLATNIFYSAFYLGLGRLVEMYYIFTETDVKGILFGYGRFFMPLDNFALILFLSTCSEIFLAELIVKNPKLLTQLNLFALLSFTFSWFNVLEWFIDSSVLVTVLRIMNIGIAILNLLIAVYIWTQINRLRKLDAEHANALKRIAQILLILVIVSAMILYLIISYPDLIQYIVRSVKNFMLIIAALLYIPAFIKPVHENVA